MRVVAPLANKIPITLMDDEEYRAWFDLYEENLKDEPDHQEDEPGIEAVCVFFLIITNNTFN